MINKQGLWFLTLFSLILVLSIYYITMPNQMFLTNNSDVVSSEDNDSNDDDTNVNASISDSDYLSVLKVEYEATRDDRKEELEKIINDSSSSKDEKNNAYEELKNLNDNKGLEELIMKNIKDSLKLSSFVKITNNEVEVIVENDKHDVTLANQIMSIVQNEFQEKVSVSVKFTK